MTGNMTSEELQVIAFDIILHSGNARTLIHEAFKLLRQGEKAEASQQLDKANEAILEAHKAQTNLLKEYASGQKIEMEIIMVHAQDHLMTTILLKDLMKHLIELYKKGS